MINISPEVMKIIRECQLAEKKNWHKNEESDNRNF